MIRSTIFAIVAVFVTTASFGGTTAIVTGGAPLATVSA